MSPVLPRRVMKKDGTLHFCSVMLPDLMVGLMSVSERGELGGRRELVRRQPAVEDCASMAGDCPEASARFDLGRCGLVYLRAAPDPGIRRMSAIGRRRR